MPTLTTLWQAGQQQLTLSERIVAGLKHIAAVRQYYLDT